MSEVQVETALSRLSGFRFEEVSSLTAPTDRGLPAPGLGPLSAFAGTFRGSGFNLIFWPDISRTPTALPKPVESDNVLELNLTLETLSFAQSLGSIPNRGMVQGGNFRNGIPYLHTSSDVTIPGQRAGIHFESGIWLCVPAATNPQKGPAVARMALVPHGMTVEAQGTLCTIAGRPAIPPVDITPFSTADPSIKKPVPSQDAAKSETARIPQDLTSFIRARTITEAMLTDPNSFLRKHIASATITSTTVITISGGATGPNAPTTKMKATFWIETVQHEIHVPIFEPGQPPLIIPANTGAGGQPVPEFLVNPPIPITAPRSIIVKATQIQYSQQVLLNFNTLTWPHVSVATLVPNSPIPVPASAFTAGKKER